MPKTMNILLYLVRALDPKERRACKIYIVLSLISPALDIISFSAVIDILQAAMGQGAVSPQLLAKAFAMAGLSVTKCFFELYRRRVTNRFVYAGAQKLSVKLHEMLLKEDLSSHNQRSVMQALALVRSDTTACVGIVTGCVGALTSGTTMLAYIAVSIQAVGWVGLLGGAAVLAYTAGLFLFYRSRIRVYGEKMRELTIRSNAQVSLAYGVFKEIKTGAPVEGILEKYQDVSLAHAQIQGKYNFQTGVLSVIMVDSLTALLFLLLGILLSQGDGVLSMLGSLVVYFTAFIRLAPLAFQIVTSLNSIESSKRSFQVVRDGLEKYQQIKTAEAAAQAGPGSGLSLKQGIAVRGLCFSYGPKAVIFEDAEMEIPAGSAVAIVGLSGAGKTTLLDLLLGLLKPQQGSISYDGKDIAGIDSLTLRGLVSYIPQTVYLNGETIRNNVAFFAGKDGPDQARIIRCLQCAHIWQDVERMPQGLDTVVGETGTAISAGQRQRIALARALYKDFELLVMDEATAALDAGTEAAVMESIRQANQTKTLLLVTHHGALAQRCDRVYQVENKKILRIK